MVYVDAAASNDIVACSGCVGVRACGRVRFALPEDWGRNSLVGGEGASPEVLQREGRWASDAYKAYVRSHGKDASWVADVMAQEGLSIGVQPGQGTTEGKLAHQKSGTGASSRC